MPELPEVETIRRGLEKYLVGHRIEKVEVRARKTLKEGEEKLVGGKIVKTRRFGKVLAIDLDNGYSALAHLKLTGQIIYRGPYLESPPDLSKKVYGGLPGKHTQVIFYLDKGGNFYFNDYRKFGWIKVVKTSEVEKTPFIEKLGPEPFGKPQGKPPLLTLELFRQLLSKTGQPIKLLLVDQEKIGGIGNIYANDALNFARIDPRKPARQLGSQAARRLYEAILKVLRLGIRYGGASDQFYLDAKGKKGHYQEHFLVYNRQGKKCFNPACRQAGAKIEKIQFRGRGTYFCPTCQK